MVDFVFLLALLLTFAVCFRFRADMLYDKWQADRDCEFIEQIKKELNWPPDERLKSEVWR